MPEPLSGFQLLRLKSECIRAMGMLLVLAVVGSIGVYYQLNVHDKPGLGSTVIVATLLGAKGRSQ